MKTIKILLFVLLSTLFLGCSKNYDDDLFEEEVEEKVLKSKTYHFKQYYEKPVVINRFTNDDEVHGYLYDDWRGSITLGGIIFQGRYINNQVIDTLTIDLTSYNKNIKEVRLLQSGSQPNVIQTKYATINYLNIIGLDENPDLKIIGESLYGKVQIINSNVSVDKLNSISGTRYRDYDMFEKIDYERKEWEWTYVIGSNNYDYENLQNRPIGYVGYAQYNARGIRIEIMNITENYN